MTDTVNTTSETTSSTTTESTSDQLRNAEAVQPVRINPPTPVMVRKPEETITLNTSTFYYLVIALIFFVAGFLTAWAVFSTTVNNTLTQAKVDFGLAVESKFSTAVARMPAGDGNAVAAAPTAVPVQNVELGDSPAWGPTDAKVTIVEFSDFQCPFCERFKTQTYSRIREKYGNQIRFVFKHFPLSQIHPEALAAAAASECAREQGKFWEYHDILFQNQQNLTRTGLMAYAQQAGISNVADFGQCVDTLKYRDRVEKDFNAGIGYSVSGTPTFFINGQYLAGALPFENFAQAIDAALAKAG